MFDEEAPIEIVAVEASHLGAVTKRLGAVLKACVEDGAGIGFVLPLAFDTAESFWAGQQAALEAGGAHLFVARRGEDVFGTVMLVLAHQDNGRHRAEVAKLMVHPAARRQGLARRLLSAVEQKAKALNRTLLVLDTVTGDTAEAMYERLGYVRVGTIPDYAEAARGGLQPTTVFYKQL